MRSYSVTIALLLIATGANAETSNLTKAVNFVLTNDENRTLMKLVDETNCVFAIDESNQVFFNNIDPESVTWTARDQVEDTSRTPGFNRPTYGVVRYRYLTVMGNHVQKGNIENSGFPSVDRFTVSLGEADGVDIERHKRAWAYIYGQGGCKPLKRETPF